MFFANYLIIITLHWRRVCDLRTLHDMACCVSTFLSLQGCWGGAAGLPPPSSSTSWRSWTCRTPTSADSEPQRRRWKKEGTPFPHGTSTLTPNCEGTSVFTSWFLPAAALGLIAGGLCFCSIGQPYELLYCSSAGEGNLWGSLPEKTCFVMTKTWLKCQKTAILIRYTTVRGLVLHRWCATQMFLTNSHLPSLLNDTTRGNCSDEMFTSSVCLVN